MKRGMDPAVAYEKIQAPLILTFEGSRFAVLALSDVRRESRLLIAPLAQVLAGRARWAPVAGFEDEVTDAVIDEGQLYLLANRDTPRGPHPAHLRSPAVAGERQAGRAAGPAGHRGLQPGGRRPLPEDHGRRRQPPAPPDPRGPGQRDRPALRRHDRGGVHPAE